MTARTETVLKGYFATGLAPTQAQLQDLVEALRRPYIRLATATPVTVDAADDEVIIVDTATIAAATAVNLPAGSNNKRVLIKDKGSAATYNITINRNGTDTIEGATTLVINTNKGWYELVFLSGVWYITDQP